MKPYPMYIKSGGNWFGDIPKHWHIRKLKYISNNINLPINVDELKGREVVHYSIPNVQEFGTGIIERGDDIDSSKLLLEEGLVILSKLNPRKSTVCIVHGHDGFLIVGSGEFIPLKFLGNNRYMYYQLINSRFTEYLNSQVESVTRSHQRIRPELLFSTLILYPEIEEQHQIVVFLDEKTALIDSLIQKKQKKIELLKEQRTAIINQVVTKGLNPEVKMKNSGVEWIGEIPEHWEIVSLRHYYTKIGSGITPRGGSEVYTEDGILFIRSQNVHFNGLVLDDVAKISPDIHESMSNSKVHFNDVLLNITGASIGRCCLVNTHDEMNVNQHVCIIRPKNSLNPRFLNFLLQSDIGQNQIEYYITGGNREGLNFENIKNFKIPLASVSEQEQINKYLDNVINNLNDHISIENRKIALLNEYRQSLISEVVTGKIDVRIN